MQVNMQCMRILNDGSQNFMNNTKQCYVLIQEKVSRWNNDKIIVKISFNKELLLKEPDRIEQDLKYDGKIIITRTNNQIEALDCGTLIYYTVQSSCFQCA